MDSKMLSSQERIWNTVGINMLLVTWHAFAKDYKSGWTHDLSGEEIEGFFYKKE